MAHQEQSVHRAQVNHRLSGFLNLLIPTFLVTGCTTQTPEFAYTRVPPPFELLDQRDSEESSTEWLSRNNASCDFTLRQMGDEALSADRFTLLREALDGTLHDQLVNRKAAVTHYAIYVNDWERDRGPAFSMNGGLIGSLIQDAIDRHKMRRCQEEMITQGRLEPVDVESHRSPVVVEITLVVDGRAHSVRSLFTPDQKISVKAKDPQTQAAIRSAVEKAIHQLIASLLIS